MVADDREEAIARYAYSLSEAEGRPQGQHERHWEEAKRHFGMTGDGTEEQTLDQPGDPKARSPEAEVQAAFDQDASPQTSDIA